MRVFGDRSRLRAHRLRLRRDRRQPPPARDLRRDHDSPRRRRSPTTCSRSTAGLVAARSRTGPTASPSRTSSTPRNVRSALKLGHARGVALLAAVEAGFPVVEYTPAEIKRAVVGYGRAEKHQVQQMVKLLLGLDAPPHAARRGRRARRRDLPPAQRRPAPCAEAAARRRTRTPRRAPKSWRDVPAMIAHACAAGWSRKQPNRLIVDVRRRRLRRARAAVDVLRARRAGRRRGAAHPHARARGRACAVRVRHGARAAALRAADRHQRHRAEARARGAVGHRAGRSRRAPSSAATSRA